jgi:hypothetical protein
LLMRRGGGRRWSVDAAWGEGARRGLIAERAGWVVHGDHVDT